MATGPVDLLLNFLKEYHLQGKDDVIRSMLHDVCADGRQPRKLGSWGELSARSVGEAVAAFEVWKSDGRFTMPALYQSQTHRSDLKCFVLRRNGDGTLDLGNSAGPESTLVKRRADPLLVQPRPLEGWYVPSRPQHGGGGPPSRPQDGSSAPPGAEAQPLGEVWTVMYAFDGAAQEYGPETYLVLHVGDTMRRLREEAGWAYAQVLSRAQPGQPTGVQGWYPADFATMKPAA